MTVYCYFFFIGGLILGAAICLLAIAKDKNLVRLGADERIIKQPMPEMVLVQVSPEVARRLVNSNGDTVSANPTEARSLYPERNRRPANQNNAKQGDFINETEK